MDKLSRSSHHNTSSTKWRASTKPKGKSAKSTGDDTQSKQAKQKGGAHHIDENASIVVLRRQAITKILVEKFGEHILLEPKFEDLMRHVETRFEENAELQTLVRKAVVKK
ncbi:hypothetical protein [Colwellia sp. MEBiC06753]